MNALTREPGDLPVPAVVPTRAGCTEGKRRARALRLAAHVCCQTRREQPCRNTPPSRRTPGPIAHAARGPLARFHARPAFAALLIASPCAAQTAGPDDTAVRDPRAPTITVTARAPQSPGEVTQAVTVLDADAVASRALPDVADLLRETPGVTIARNGGPGQTASVFIRGGDSDQTQVVIDGIKVNDPTSPAGAYDFSDLPTAAVTRIEVLRGIQSVLWGSSAIGGVVSVTTGGNGGERIVRAQAEAGWRGTVDGSAILAGRYGKLDASIAGGLFTTDGISAADERDGNPERDGYKRGNVAAKLALHATEWLTLDARLYAVRGRAGFDGGAASNYALADTPDYSRRAQVVAYGGATGTFLDGGLTQRLGYAEFTIKRDNYDPTLLPNATALSFGLTRRAEYEGTAKPLGWLQLVWGIEREVSRYRQSFPSPFDPAPAVDDQRATLTSGYADATVTPARGLTLNGGVRRDEQSHAGGATTFNAGAAYTPNDGRTKLRLAYGEGFKAPTLYQLFSAYGNTALQPTRARGFDGGIEQRVGGVTLGFSAFERRTRGLVDFVDCTGSALPECADRPYGTYRNVARARSSGVEGSATGAIGDLRLTGAATYLIARDESAGANLSELPRRPRLSTTLGADWAPKRLPVSLGATVTEVGRSFDNAADANRLAPYTLIGARARLRVRDGVDLTLRGENLGGDHYQTALGYGQPGRQVYAGVEARF